MTLLNISGGGGTPKSAPWDSALLADPNCGAATIRLYRTHFSAPGRLSNSLSTAISFSPNRSMPSIVLITFFAGIRERIRMFTISHAAVGLNLNIWVFEDFFQILRNFRFLIFISVFVFFNVKNTKIENKKPLELGWKGRAHRLRWKLVDHRRRRFRWRICSFSRGRRTICTFGLFWSRSGIGFCLGKSFL